MHKHVVYERALVFCLIVTALYGVSYQQFRHYDYNDTRGLIDSHSYLAMAQGNWDVTPIHRFRFIIPLIAGFTCHIISRCELTDLSLIFYAINFCVVVATAVLFYDFLKRLRFKGLLPLVGVYLFICSRVTVVVTAAPLVDSLYLLSIVLIAYLLVVHRFLLLLALYPFLILTKETIAPFLFLPLLFRSLRSWRYLTLWAASIVVSFAIFKFTRNIIGLSPQTGTELTGSFGNIVILQIYEVGRSASRLLSLSGLHDLHNGFLFILPLSAMGFYLNRRYRMYEIPNFLSIYLLVSAGFALLSGNMGRMIFSTAYVIIIPYALVVVDCVIHNARFAPHQHQ